MVTDTRVPDGWRELRLEDVADFQQGGTPSKSRAEYWDGHIPFVTGADLREFRIDRDSARSFLTAKGLNSGTTAICEPGALLLTTRTRVGLTSIAKETMGASQDITLLRANGLANPSYLCRILVSHATLLQRRSQGTTIQGVSREDVASLPILLPPIPEQRAISAVLDSIDEAIERTESVITATERLRDPLLHELLSRGVPGGHSEWKEVRGVGTIPADWEVVRLGHVASHVGSGITPRGGRSVYQDSGVKFIRSQNVHFEGLRLDDVVSISPDTDSAMSRSRVYAGDVLLNITGASIGRCTTVPADLGPANVNQHVCIIRPTACANPAFVSEWIGTPRSQREIDEVQIGQSRQGLNYQQVRGLTVVLPSRREQDVIAELISSIRVAVRSSNEQLAELVALRSSTTDALLTGRVRVSA